MKSIWLPYLIRLMRVPAMLNKHEAYNKLCCRDSHYMQCSPIL